MEPHRPGRGEGWHAACACGDELLRGTLWCLRAAVKALTCAKRGAKMMERMRKHTPGQQGHVSRAVAVVVSLREETVYIKRPLGSYAVPT
jgi:hypothetical protein